MYVIFPADEVVYLSYGRLIYIPSPEQVQQTSEQVPSNSHQSAGSYSSVPSTSTSSTRSFHSTASAPSFDRNNSNEALTRTRSVNSSKSFNLPSTSKGRHYLEKPPVRPNRKKEKITECSSKETFLRIPTALKPKQTPKQTRKLSYSDFVGLNREVNLTVPHQDFLREKSGSRERSPKNSNRSSPVNFNGIFKRDLSPNKISSRDSSPYKTDCADKRLQIPGTHSKTEKSPSVKKKGFFGVRSRKAPEAAAKMAASESPLRDLTHPFYNEHLKSHNSVTFKLVKTVADFTQQLGQMYEQHAGELQLLVSNFRKRNGELRKERPACPSSLFHTWETLLQEVEIDSQALADIASILGRQVSRPLLEKSFYRKMQSRKVFTHRESYETIIAKTEEKLSKCRQEYKTAYLEYLTTPTTDSLSAYFNTHNAYVQQLHATNGMLEEYGKGTLPQLLQELEEIYTDLCATVSEAVLQGAEVVSSRSMEQCRRYEGLVAQCKGVASSNDLAHLSRSLPSPPGRGPVMRRLFVPPQPPVPPDPPEDGSEIVASDSVPPPLKDELVIDRLSAVQVRPSHDALRKEAADLEAQIRQIQDALDTLQRIQLRSVEANLYNKANEIQEDISMKRFDLRVAQIHLSAIIAQKELFSNKLDTGETGRERKNSSASTASMKNKWLKAFKSLKTPPPEEKKNGSAASRELLKGDPDAHNFQEYTYKKITPCDVCSQVLRGHTRQGLKCRICKINVHVDCQEKASKCQAKARLLRRQKSTSEIETRLPDACGDEESIGIDDTYSGMPTMNRQLSIKVNNPAHPPVTTIDRRQAQGASATESSMRRRLFAGMKSLTGFGSRSRHGSPGHRSISLPETPHSPRRQKLNLRMKSLSLDSPESTEHVQRRKHHGAATTSDPHSNQSSSSRIQSPSSPVHNRRLLSAKNIRMSSVELPDENDKSPSSASTSPCPSPVGGKKSHRLLPTNLYVVLYNFKSRHQDELDLKAGYKVTVIDTSDPDWWKGKCLGRVGYFPSKYCAKLSPGEKPLQVTHNLQVSDGDNGLMLLRDQIVIQIGEELDGMVMIRSGDNRQGICPVKFLQEV